MQIHLAPLGLENELREELSRVDHGGRLLEEHGRLFFSTDGPPPYFSQNSWLDVQRFEFNSISEAVKKLRDIQRNWWLHSLNAHRRAQLIREGLPVLKLKRVDFMAPVPRAPLGAWTLLDEKTMLYSSRCTSAFPDGEVEFIENKTDPPSRAYLKLWEFFTLTGRLPKAGDRCLDLGSSPGGWTWVLDQLGAQVISVDKAPLASTTVFSARVESRLESAFGLEPKDVGKVDWLFSDIICYPDRLLDLVHKWKDFATNMVCTIKFQGPTDYKAIEDFLKIPGSSVRHLYCNKHELTWSRLSDEPS